MKTQPFSLEQLSTPKTPQPKKSTQPKRKHWSDEFFKHLDAWGAEMRKSKRKANA